MKHIKGNCARGSTAYLWFVCLVSAGGGLLFGYDVIVVSGIIPQVINQFELTAFQLGFLVSCALWGSAIGSACGGIFLDAFGRKKVLIMVSVILFISVVWSSMASSTALLICARLLGGVGCGLAATACPLYISEVSPEQYRGRMVTLYHFAVCLGIVICVFANWAIFLFAEAHADDSILSPFWKWFAVEQHWRAMFLSEALPGVLFLLGTLILPESPRWLVKNHRTAEAEMILAALNGRQKAHQICAEIEDTIRLERRVIFSDLFTAKLFRPLLLSILICIFSEACGISVVLYYGPQLFEQAGLSLGRSLGGFSVIAIVLLVFNIVSMQVIDTVGRRKLLAVGATGALVSLVTIGSLFLAEQTGLWTVFAIAAFVAFFASSIGPVKFVVLSEIFPNPVRGKAISVGMVSIWLSSAAVAQVFPLMQEKMHTGYIFFCFALDVAALLVVVKFLMPETRGRTIEAIERSWLDQQNGQK